MIQDQIYRMRKDENWWWVLYVIVRNLFVSVAIFNSTYTIHSD